MGKNFVAVAGLVLPLMAGAQSVPSITQMFGDRAAPAPEAKVVRIGHVGPTSGAIGHLGKDNELGARMAINALNSMSLTMQGMPVVWELQTEDDQADPVEAVAAARRLVRGGVHGVVGHLNSGASIPGAAVYNAAGIPMVSPSSTNPKLTRLGYRGVFRLVGDDMQMGEQLGRVAVERFRAKKILVLDDRTAYGAYVSEGFVEGVRKAGSNIADQAYLPEGNKDYRQIASRAQSLGPDVIFFAGMDTDAGPLLRDLRRAGVRSMFIGGDGICSSDLPKLTGAALGDERVLCAEAGGVTSEEADALKVFKEDFRKQYGQEIQVYAPYTYDAVMVLANAMISANSTSPQEYLPKLKSTPYTGVTGAISFDNKGDLLKPAFTMMTYKGGQRITAGVVR